MSQIPPQPQAPENSEADAFAEMAWHLISLLVIAAAVVAILPVLAVVGLTLLGIKVVPRTKPRHALLLGLLALAVTAIVPGWHEALLDYGHAFMRVRTDPWAASMTLIVALPAGLLIGSAVAKLAMRPDPGRWVRWLGLRPKPWRGTGLAPDARVATEKELAPLVVKRPGSRFVLGYSTHEPKRLLAAAPEHHVFVCAPSGSGKGRGAVIPAILDAPGHVVVTSSKDDVLVDRGHGGMGTLAHRQEVGEVFIADFGGMTNYDCLAWSPLVGCEEYPTASRIAHALLEAAGRKHEDGTSQFFAARAVAVLAPLLHAAALEDGLSMRDVLRWTAAGPSEASEIIATLGDDAALEALERAGVGSDTSLGDTMATIQTLLRVFEDPVVAARTAEPTFEPADLFLGASNSLYVLCGGMDAQRLAPLYAALVGEVVEAARRKAEKDGPFSPPLRLVLDEIATTAPIASLPNLLAVSRGYGIQAMVVIQSLGQLDARWSREERGTIVSNCRSQVWWRTDDPETAEYLSKLIGEEQWQQWSASEDAARTRTHSISVASRSTLSGSAFRTEARPILISTGIPAAPMKPRFYDQDRHLRHLATQPVALGSRDDVGDERSGDSNSASVMVIVSLPVCLHRYLCLDSRSDAGTTAVR